MDRQVTDLEKIMKCEEFISKKESEIDYANKKIKEIQQSCLHPTKVCLGKQVITMGFSKHESEYVECLICGKELNLINTKADIDLSDEFIDITSNKKRLMLRRQLARTMYLNSEHLENESKVLVKK